ncbi:methylenetetrahydrofolate reductase [NAD(P)H] [Vitreimonas flagellata]|uniref:methylenetetrahydrofolate reductase [NAD(P)H] n=1 Tax=Vitreimonas flagellata TaxID=2560861 RepID=UPI001075232C|nr:methylenetetrahydrofolate reductase [NAD(P)H] [Vitreimonas flagellata]
MSAHAQNLIAEAAERMGRPRVSFEFFPPKTQALETQLWESIRKLEPLDPSFVSVTYGAGGSTRDRTHRTVARIVEETTLKPAAHLTCVGASRDEIDSVLRDYWSAGVRHIVALRGDPPGGVGTPYAPHPEGYASAVDLVEGAKRIGGFEISVAVHPEKHPASLSWAHDVENFKRKLEAGATRGISQFFFDADVFLRFRDRLASAGVTAPILPGIMPVTNVKGLRKMAEGCGASLPAWLIRLFDGLDDDPDTRRLVTAATTAQLCAQLAAEGVEDFHFYTLNRADLTLAICRILGVRVQEQAA